VVAIRFETDESLREFYDSPEYQAVTGKRPGATDGFAVLVTVRRRTRADLSQPPSAVRRLPRVTSLTVFDVLRYR
jgi:hypothetical protein